MDNLTPDPRRVRLENDIERPLKPMQVGHRRLPAALPIAIAGILVVASVAFGATVVNNIVIGDATPTPANIGDENPTPTPTPTLEPTAEPTEAPTAAESHAPKTEPTPTDAPTAGTLSLTVEALAGKVKLTWNEYAGDSFAYYKVVRTTGTNPQWPLGTGDKLVAAIDNQQTTTFTDCTGGGTFTYRVFAVTSGDDGYQVLAVSNAQTVTVAPAGTPQPVVNPSDMGALRVTDNGDGTYTFSWNAYTGPIQFSYYKLSGVPYPQTPGYVENGGNYWQCLSPDQTSVTMAVEPGTWNINVEAVYFPDSGAAAAGKTDTLKLTVAQRTAPPVLSLTLTGVLQPDGSVLLNWSKYTGPYFDYYGIVRTEGSQMPSLQPGSTPKVYFDNVNTLSYKDTGKGPLGKLLPGHTYHYQVYAYTEQTFSSIAAGVVPNCYVGTIVAVSPVVDVTIPAATPTPAPTDQPTPEPTPAPSDSPTA